MAENREGLQESAREWEITFSLAAGYDEQDAIDLYELVEAHPAVDGAVLAGRAVPVADGVGPRSEPENRGEALVEGPTRTSVNCEGAYTDEQVRDLWIAMRELAKGIGPVADYAAGQLQALNAPQEWRVAPTPLNLRFTHA